MGIERIMNIEAKLRKLAEQVELKEVLKEDFADDLNKMRMLSHDLRKEIKDMYAEMRWSLATAAAAENKVNGKYNKMLTRYRATV